MKIFFNNYFFRLLDLVYNNQAKQKTVSYGFEFKIRLGSWVLLKNR